MAIVKMKKLRLVASRRQKTELIKQLMLLGCVELREQDDVLSDPRTSSLVSKEIGGIADLRAEQALLSEGIKLLDKYAPGKTPLLSAKPDISEKDFLDDTELVGAHLAAGEIIALDEKIRACYAEEQRCAALVEQLDPWKGYDIPLDSGGTESVALCLGTLPASADYNALCAALTARLDAVEVFDVSADEHTRYIGVLFMRSDEDAAMDVLRGYGFALPAFGDLKGLAKDNIAEALEKADAAAKQRAVHEALLVSDAQNRQQLKRCYDRIGTQLDRAIGEEMLLHTEEMLCLEGWATEPETDRLIALLEKFDCAYELEEPPEEEYGDVPVKLKNNAFTNSMNMVTNMYSLPRYGTVDPNPLMAPFFILFYGIMMADMGYGLLMIIAALVAMKKIRPKEGTLSFCQLLLYGGITTFIMGAITGGFFADAPYQLVHMLNPESTWQGLPSLFDPLNDSIYVLLGAMALGFIQLNTGLAVSFVMKLRRGEVADAILYEGGLWVLAIGIILFVLKVGSIAGVPVVLVIGALMLVVGTVKDKKGISKITAVFGLLYNELTGWFGDLLSYSRIMALMLAGSVIAQVFNTLGTLPGNIFVFIIIFVIGHALNFGLNLLGCFVHDLRLQCLEYFNKFYTDGGRPFKPLRIKSKYFNIVK